MIIQTINFGWPLTVTARSIIKNAKPQDFMKIMNLNIGMFSCLNELMKISEYKWSRSFFEFWPKILIVWYFLSPQKPTVTK